MIKSNEFLTSISKSLIEASSKMLSGAQKETISTFGAVSQIKNRPQTIAEQYQVTNEDLKKFSGATHVAIEAPGVADLHGKIVVVESYHRRDGIATVLVEGMRYRLKKGQYHFIPESVEQLNDFVASVVRRNK